MSTLHELWGVLNAIRVRVRAHTRAKGQADILRELAYDLVDMLTRMDEVLARAQGALDAVDAEAAVRASRRERCEECERAHGPHYTGPCDHRSLRVELPETVIGLIQAIDPAATPAVIIHRILDHVQQGVYRPGAWEREWLCQAMGQEWLANLEWGDPFSGEPSQIFQRPKGGAQ